MRNKTIKLLIITLALIVLYISCSLFQKKIYLNSNEIQQEITNHLKNEISKKERSILKGLLWSELYIQENDNFDYIFSDYLVMLNELYKSQYNFVRHISKKMIQYNLKRGSSRLKHMFENSVSDKWDFISIIPIVLRFEIDVNHYSQFYKNNFPESFNNKDYHKYSFKEALNKENHDELGNYIIDMVFVDMIDQEKNLFPMPENLLELHLKKIENIPFKYRQSDFYHDQNYFITHIILAASHYGDKKINLNNPLVERIKKYIINNFKKIRYEVDDIDLLGEMIHCWKICKIEKNQRYKESIQYLIKKQKKDGSWYDDEEADEDDTPYDIFHPTWAVITALSAQ